MNTVPSYVLQSLNEVVRTLTPARLSHLIHDESGQDLIEYALVAALIGVGAVLALRGLTGKISNAFNTVGNNLTSDI
jgi:pilus assembly protein Flp/PilA